MSKKETILRRIVYLDKSGYVVDTLKETVKIIIQEFSDAELINEKWFEVVPRDRKSWRLRKMTECGVAEKIALLMESCLGCPAGHKDCPLNSSLIKAQRKLDLERLARLEHEQWSHWTRYMLNNLTDENIARWKRQMATDYSALTEKEKDSDREWAKKILEQGQEKPPCPSGKETIIEEMQKRADKLQKEVHEMAEQIAELVKRWAERDREYEKFLEKFEEFKRYFADHYIKNEDNSQKPSQ